MLLPTFADGSTLRDASRLPRVCLWRVDVATTAHVLQRRIVGLRATRTFWYRIVSTHQTSSFASLSFDDAATEEADGHALCNKEQKIPTR